MELDLGAVRAFVAIVEHRHFGEAAVQLEISQQAISKRIAKLEADLGATLFHRARGGASLSEDGESFLTYARALIGTADQATEAIRRRRRPLRVDVLNTRIASTELLRAFHQDNRDVEIDIVLSDGFRSAHPGLVRGTIDATFVRTIGTLHESIARTPAYLEPLHLLVGRGHRLASRKQVRLAELAGATAWMPGNEPDSEWADFYRGLAAEFSLRIDTTGPDFGIEYLLDELGEATDKISFAGEKTQLPWHPRIVRIPVTRPIPVYPFTLLWRRDNRHPALPALIEHVRAGYRPPDPREISLSTSERADFGLDG
ncbi:LysR family transcriptional regulator [Amycolatopsis nigrescens]|uniref:LysR family transcriptional regulator n=1 Tax=Amycolatopsis nigrescens TaxID=381445 RepID=UPI00037E7581|nr:LysR family transcriptional regulator [Amycolatopsis nigrescens]